jgi:hypothetical protein
MNMAPLGWSRGRILFIVATASDTSIYSAVKNRVSFTSILLTQPITSATLSPDGRWIAFGAPGSCYYCTLDVFDLANLTIWNGPSAVPGEHALAWTADSRWIVAPVGRHLALISPFTHDQKLFSLPRALDSNWPDPMRALVGDGSLTLIDVNSGRVYNLQPIPRNR